MSRKNKIDDEIREQAGEAGKAARQFAEQGKDWATPKVEAAMDWAGPRVEKAWKAGVTATAPKLADAAGKSRDAVDIAHDKLVDDVLPKVIAALEDAARAAAGGADDVQDRVHSAVGKAEKALKEQEKAAKGGSKLGKTLGWVLVGSAVAGAGVLIWRRTQPVDDPWAEEYWDDSVAPAVETPATTPAETKPVTEKVQDAAAGAKDKAAGAKDKLAETAKDASAKVEKVTEDIKDSANETKKD